MRMDHRHMIGSEGEWTYTRRHHRLAKGKTEVMDKNLRFTLKEEIHNTNIFNARKGMNIGIHEKILGRLQGLSCPC